MKIVGAFEAKTHFSELLSSVDSGETFAITRHGKKIAKLIPFMEEEKDSSSKSAIKSIRTLRAGIKLGKKLSIKQMRAEGRR